MKYAHLAVALFYVVFTIVNIGSLGIGEWVAVAEAILFFVVTRGIMKKDYTGYYLAGMLVGLTVEYLTEAYWEYSLNVFFATTTPIWNDISPYVVLGWGFSFTLFVAVSGWLFPRVRALFGAAGVPGSASAVMDPWHLLFDAALGIPYFVVYEIFGMKVLGLWRYLPVSKWTTMVPVLDYPLEALIGAALFAMVLPAFVRSWGTRLRAGPPFAPAEECSDV